MVSKAEEMSSGRLTPEEGIWPVARARSHAARPAGPDNSATAPAMTSSHGASAAVRRAAYSADLQPPLRVVGAVRAAGRAAP